MRAASSTIAPRTAAPDYSDMDDDCLIVMAQTGDETAQAVVLNKYRHLAQFKARSYFLHGADREDTLQEGMIGLFKAIRDYKPDGLCSFRSFALLCITRQIITAIKAATRKKHSPLNTYTPLVFSDFDTELSANLTETMSSAGAEDPLDMFIVDEEIDRIKQAMREALSELEWEVLVAYVDGKSYREIADSLHRHTKVIDNALYRVKQKLRELG